MIIPHGTNIDDLLDYADPLTPSVGSGRKLGRPGSPGGVQHTDSWIEFKKHAPGAEDSPASTMRSTATTSSGRRIVSLGEDEVPQSSWCKRHIVHPNNPWKLKWDIIMMVTIT